MKYSNNERFCVWAYRNRGGKETKIPYNPITGAKARSNDEQTFGSYEDACSMLKARPNEFDGIGIGLFGDLVGIDIDHCVDANGNISALASDIVKAIDSYAEYSPSGTGIHIICRAPGLEYDKDNYYLKKTDLGLEMYIAGKTNRYFTLTEKTVSGSTEDVCNRTEAVMSVLNKYMLRSKNKCVNASEYEEYTSLDDAEVINRMLNSANGEKIAHLWAGDFEEYFKSQSEADLSLCNTLAFWTRKDAEQMDRIFRTSGLMRSKWDEPRAGKGTYGKMTIDEAIASCKSIWTPGFSKNVYGGVKSALEFLETIDFNDSRYSLNDVGAGYVLADFLKPFARPILGSHKWIAYNGVFWNEGLGEATVQEAAKDVSRALKIFAGKQTVCDYEKFAKWAALWSQHQKRRQYIAEAQSVYTVSRSEFDTNQMLLNLNNGTFDLNTMTLKEHNPDDLITQVAPTDYVKDAKCERWESFISEIMEPGESEHSDNPALHCKEKAEFLKRYLGYCLGGGTKEEAFMIMYGPSSRNGKSVCVNAVQSVMGSYARTTSADTLMLIKAKDGSAPTEDIARLAGARLVCVGELPKSGLMNAARVKSMTGGDKLTARFLGENSFEFKPQFKMILHTNHLPECNDMAVFASDRIRVLMFSRHFEEFEQDKSLKSLFSTPTAQSGILNWLLDGWEEYKVKGLSAPETVKAATNEYRMDNDKISRFAEEMLRKKADGEISVKYLYQEFVDWCKSNGQYAEGHNSFLHGLHERKFETRKIWSRVDKGVKANYLIGYTFANDLDLTQGLKSQSE